MIGRTNLDYWDLTTRLIAEWKLKEIYTMEVNNIDRIREFTNFRTSILSLKNYGHFSQAKKSDLDS